MVGVSKARISQIEHGKVTEVDAIRRYVEALGGTADIVGPRRRLGGQGRLSRNLELSQDHLCCYRMHFGLRLHPQI